jgi:hypothetical protein
MVLVPHDIYNATKLHPVTPVGEKIVSLDGEMENVLKDDALTDSEKVTRYTDTMQKFMDYQKQYTPSNHQVTPSAAAGEMQNGGESDSPGEKNSEYFSVDSNTLPNEDKKQTVIPKSDNEEDIHVAAPTLKTSKPVSKRLFKKKVEYFFSNPWLVSK